jgi:ABC-type transport system involved in multi-copper enzyme maturation permease subunit
MPDWVWAAVAGVVAVLTAAGVALFRWRVGPIFGPMFRYELVRLTRRGQLPRLRALLVGLLLAGLFVTYLKQFQGRDRKAFLLGGSETKLSIDQTAQFAGNFFIAFLTAQLAAVLLITPAVAGSAITEEKERGTLDHLRGSLLTGREIVLGKLAARMVFVAGVVLAGVPVLALTSLFGGVDWRVMLAGYVLTAVTGAWLAALSLLLGVSRDGLREVLVWVYGFTAGTTVFGLCCGCCVPGLGGVSPVSVLLYLFADDVPATRGGNTPAELRYWANLAVYAVLYGIGTLVCAFLAVRRMRGATPVRRRAPHRRPLARGVPGSVRREPVMEQLPMRTTARRTFPVPRLGKADPFLWKERYFSGRMSPTEGGLLTGCGIGLLSAVLFGLGLALFVAASVELHEGRWFGAAINPFLRVFLSGSTVLVALGVGARAAAAVARERQKQTLDGLLTLPVSRAELLRAKWLAQVVWARYAVIGMAVTAVVAALFGGVHPAGLVLGLLQTAAFLACAVTAGLWLSVRCRTVTRATVYFMLWMLGTWVGPVVLAPVVGVLVGGTGDAGEVVLSLSPPVGVWFGLFAWGEPPDPDRDPLWWARQGMGAVAAVGYLAVAGLMWLDAVQVFGREGNR